MGEALHSLASVFPLYGIKTTKELKSVANGFRGLDVLLRFPITRCTSSRTHVP
jgi:hypothetical protein